MEKQILQIAERTEFGKGASRRIRREGGLPVVVYGHGAEPKHYVVDYHDAFLMVRGNPNALLTLKSDDVEQLVMVKDVQRNPLTRNIEHLDLLRVKAGEKVAVEVPVVVEGEPMGDAIATIELMVLPVEVPVQEIPEAIVIDVEGVEDGTNITLADVKFPTDVTTDLPEDEVVVVVAVPQVEALPEAEEGDAAEAPAEEAPAEDAE
ncbi:50S ribosomal protein L25 [Trueperella bernardiae]|uniref:50S ribosomal protein L25/general stress protein Ctc n=1 Tax=Trueperella bernardiae TaxID=59561 RepID=UPI000C7A9805|nr:50S ribosomal protein L25/general stress protein Ctc [Trueperella bernardiae]PKZ88784.1 50S ribosomal protein L25 [Trueperella bernardiae]